jgi:hypothetical protein
MTEPDRPRQLRRGRRAFTTHAVIAGVFAVLCFPTWVPLLSDRPVYGSPADLPPRAFLGTAVALIGVGLALCALVASALLARAALAPALASGGATDANRVASARRWCAIGTWLGLGGYAAGIVVGVVNSLVVDDFLPTWLAVTSSALGVLALLIVRRGLARDLWWLTRA